MTTIIKNGTVFVIQEGKATFTVGDDTIDANGGQIVIVPAGVPHKYVNSGEGVHAEGSASILVSR